MDKNERRLPPPSQCDNCESVRIVFTTNDKLYGTLKGDWPYAYLCLQCRASVACHAQTNSPLGLMADKATRRLRQKAHAAFDLVWKNGIMTRDAAYKWLGQKLNLSKEDCHIALLSKANLLFVINEINAESASYRKAILKRKLKKEKKEKSKLLSQIEKRKRIANGR